MQAQKVRRLVKNDFDAVFGQGEKSVDVILAPTANTSAPAFKAVTDSEWNPYVNDIFTVSVSLAGLPAISIPINSGAETVGVQIICNYGQDNMCLKVAGALSKL